MNGLDIWLDTRGGTVTIGNDHPVPSSSWVFLLQLHYYSPDRTLAGWNLSSRSIRRFDLQLSLAFEISIVYPYMFRMAS